MKVPAGIAAVVIAAQSENRDRLDDAYRAATTVFDVPVARAVAVSPDGLYAEGQVRCELILYCDGSVGCFPCAAETDGTPPVALENWAHWHYALIALGVTPPWTQDELADFDEWLAAMVEEAELGYSDDAMCLLSSEMPAVGYELRPSTGTKMLIQVVADQRVKRLGTLKIGGMAVPNPPREKPPRSYRESAY